MNETFGIDQRDHDGVPVIVVSGEIDLATAPELRTRIQRELAAGHPRIIIDLLGVSFLDSTALGVMVGGLKQCRAAGGDLELLVAEARILKIFDITGLSEVF